MYAACKKISDKFAEGLVTIEGKFQKAHRDEIIGLIRNKEERAMHFNPLDRIIEIKDTEGKIKVFTAGCPLCNDTLKMVREATKDCGCEIIERRCSGDVCCDEALKYGVKTVPAIAVDGIIVFEGKPTREQARALLSRW